MLMLASPSGVRRLQAHASRLYALIGSAEGAKSLDQSADFQQTRGFAADDGRQGGAASRPSTSTSMAAAQPRRDRSQRYMADPRSASAPSDDLAMANAPKRVLALIGDPRTGVADDTSNNPFGDVTVDMIHHSLTNEVYWFKYEFSGQSVSATHRNGRLSDYSKNLMYLLRASDPATWTIDALAEKFRIRKQRVLAILALKEMESQAIKKGEMLSGPMSAYAFKVHLADLRVRDVAGGGGGNGAGQRVPPVAAADQQQQQQEGEDGQPLSSGQGQRQQQQKQQQQQPLADVSLPVVFPSVVDTAQRLQVELLRFLSVYDYDPERLKAALLADLAKAEEYYKQHLGGGDGGGGSGGATAGASEPAAASPSPPAADAADGAAAGESAKDGPASPASSSSSSAPAAPGQKLFDFDFPAARARIEALVASLAPLLDGQTLQAERATAALARTLREHVATVAGHAEVTALIDKAAASEAGSGDDAKAAKGGVSLAAVAAAAAGAAFSDEGVQLAQAAVQEAVAPLKKGDKEGSGQLLRSFLQLPLADRRVVAALDPETFVVVKGVSAGLDLSAAAPSGGGWGGAADWVGPPGSADGGSELLSLPADVYDFRPLSDAALQGVVDAVAALQSLAGDAEARVSPLGEVGSLLDPVTSTAADDIREALRLAKAYAYADAMVAKLSAGDGDGGGDAAAAAGAAAEHPAGEGAVGRGGRSAPAMSRQERLAMLQVLQEAGPQLVEGVAVYEALKTREAGRGSKEEAEQMRASLVAAEQQRSAGDDAAIEPGSPQEYARRADWDLLSAWIDVFAAKRLFHRGSGERHRVQLSTLPAFQGYSLQEFDDMVARDGEGEYSRLNRLAAEREGARLYASFHADLLYNLGCLAPDNWDGSKPRPAPNLAAAVSDHSMVVYNIDDAGVTGPPLHVALADGSRRDLNEGERVYQARRKPVSLARYQWRRQRWMHEWGDE